MDADTALIAAQNLAIFAVLLLVFQVALLAIRERRGWQQRVRNRLLNPNTVIEHGDQETALVGGRYQRLLMKAGLQLGQNTLMLLALVVVAAALLVLATLGWLWALLVPVAAALLAVFYWNLRYQKQRRIIFEALPEVIDDTIRSIDAGRSLEQALVESLGEAPPVFEPLSFRVRSAVEAGREYTELMDDFAELYQVPPLVFVAVALRTSSRFGSSVRPVLKKVSESLRSQQEMRREFLAATAETRFTAGAFAILPIAIGAGLIAMNKNFREVLLGTDTGHIMLAISGGLIFLGMAVIFRMIQGVGRG